jgi:hypothetical protein
LIYNYHYNKYYITRKRVTSMKLILSVFIILFTLTFSSHSEIDVEKVIEDFSIIQNTGNAGREFWLTFKPIDTRTGVEEYKNLYIFSSVKTKIDINLLNKMTEYHIINSDTLILNFNTNILQNSICNNKINIVDKKLLESKIHKNFISSKPFNNHN